MYTLLALFTALVRLWVPQTPADCEMPPWMMNTPNRNPATIITDYFASEVVGAKDVGNPTNALGSFDPQQFDPPHAVLTQTSVLTVSWTFPFKSGAGLWVYTPDGTCPYAKITISHYASLTSAPITTTVVWLSTGQAKYTGIGDDIDWWVLPLHRYVVITTSWPIWVDSVFHQLYEYLEIRWMPIVFAQ